MDFSDVLIVPQSSDLKSRSEVDVERTFFFRHSKRYWRGVPIAVANMDTTGTLEMAKELQKHHILTCLHKFYTPEEILEADLNRNYFTVGCGTSDKDMEKLATMVKLIQPFFICLDVANGYLDIVIDRIQHIRSTYPDITLIAGNVVTPERVKLYDENGVDIIKMGIGSGSVCTTRLQTGVGYPQFSSIVDTRKALPNECVIMSDGGIQHPGDFAKAYGAGADFVMCGGMFAGHDESAGEMIIENGVPYKVFYGMSSTQAMKTHYGGVAKHRSAEGKSVKLKYRGPVENTILDILGGIRSTMTYVGAATIDKLYGLCKFIRVNNTVNRIYTGKEV
jgi:GMP reductase